MLFLGGRNRRVAEAFVKTGRSIKELEDELLNGQKLQGPITAEEVHHMLANRSMEKKWVFEEFWGVRKTKKNWTKASSPVIVGVSKLVEV